MKAEVGKLVINKLVNVSASLNDLKTKVDDLHVDKLKTVPIDLKKLIVAVNKENDKNTELKTLKTKINKLDKKMIDATTLIHINQYNTNKQSLMRKLELLIKKLLDLIGLITAAVLDAKIRAVVNKIPKLNGLVQKTDYDIKILEIDGKCFTTSDYNKLTNDILDTKIKQKK